MQFDLGVRALHRFLDPRPAHYIGKIVSDGPNYEIEIAYTDPEGNETVLSTTARQLLPLSFSYEIGDKVVVAVNSFVEHYILGLASDLEGTDTTTDFFLRFGKNTIRGKKDGTSLVAESGDGNFKITHDMLGTKIECSGLVSVNGDIINVGNAIAPALNSCTVCPLQGMHLSTVPTINIG